MNWLEQLKTRFHGRGVHHDNPLQRIENCLVDLRGFPSERLILDVDKLNDNDAFVSRIISRREQRCDLIVFYDNSGAPSVTLIEAKSNRKGRRDDEFKAVEQLTSSHRILRRGLDQCSIDLPEFSITGAVVTGSLNSGALMRPDLKATVSAAEIDIKVVPSGFDIFRY